MRETDPNAARKSKVEESDPASPYAIIADTLATDAASLFAYLEGKGTLSKELLESYEITPPELPDLRLPDRLDFVGGFSYVSRQWYPIVKAIAVITEPTPEMEHAMNTHLEGMFKDAIVTVQGLRQALQIDPSGATWLEQRARAEFRQGNLELMGARSAIKGISRMFEELTA